MPRKERGIARQRARVCTGGEIKERERDGKSKESLVR